MFSASWFCCINQWYITKCARIDHGLGLAQWGYIEKAMETFWVSGYTICTYVTQEHPWQLQSALATAISDTWESEVSVPAKFYLLMYVSIHGAWSTRVITFFLVVCISSSIPDKYYILCTTSGPEYQFIKSYSLFNIQNPLAISDNCWQSKQNRHHG